MRFASPSGIRNSRAIPKVTLTVRGRTVSVGAVIASHMRRECENVAWHAEEAAKRPLSPEEMDEMCWSFWSARENADILGRESKNALPPFRHAKDAAVWLEILRDVPDFLSAEGGK